MRALILRRVGLLEIGAGGPIIVGRADDGDVLRLGGLPDAQRPSAPPARPGRAIPRRRRCSSASMSIAGRAADRALPGRRRCCAIRREVELARCIGLVRPDRSRQALRRRHRRRRAGRSGGGGLCRVGGPVGRSCSTAARSAARPAPRRGSRTISAFRPASRGLALMARAYNQAQKFGVEMAIPDEVDGPRARERRRPHSAATWPTTSGSARARSCIASGARYRRLDVPRTSTRSRARACTTGPRRWRRKLCAGQEVALVGGGNSAGQAVVYLAGQVAKVWLLVRGARSGGHACRAI